MAYSFINLPEKSPFFRGVKRIWVAFAVAAVCLLTVAYLLHGSNADRVKAYQAERNDREALALQIGQLEARNRAALKQQILFERVQTSSQLAMEQVSDLLDLVPDGTTLTRFELFDGALVVAGQTRDMEAFDRRFVKALSGPYRLAESRIAPESNATKTFVLEFETRKAHE